MHDAWFKTLDQIAALKPAVIVPGHFALDTAADEIAALVQGFAGSSR